MKIVSMEANAVNFDHLVPEDFLSCGCEFISWGNTKQYQLISRAEGADAILINKLKLGEKEFAALPGLKYIGVQATGWNVVDTTAARKHGVIVTNIPAYSTTSVVQLTFAHILNLCRQVEFHAQSDWSKAPCFCNCLTPQIELDGLTLGIFGFGSIGRAVAKTALTFGMKVITLTRSPEKVRMPGVAAVDEKTFFSTGDIITLHAPQTPDTIHIINERTLAMMKPTAFLINTARGGLVDETALADALKRHRIAGAGLDVLSEEPPPTNNPLIHLSNCRVTPHIAWATKEARMRLLECSRKNLLAWLEGNPVNVVS